MKKLFNKKKIISKKILSNLDQAKKKKLNKTFSNRLFSKKKIIFNKKKI